MKRAYLGPVIFSLLAFAAGNLPAQQTAWSSTSSGDWGTIGNWTNGLPSTGPKLAVYRGTATLQKFVTLGSPGRESVGMLFTLTALGSGYSFSGISGPSGFFVRAGGSVNGIINSDDNTQTFNVPIKLLDSSGLAGSGAAMTWNAAAGSMVFNGANTAPAANWTINLNGASALTIDGSFNISVGTSGAGQIVNTNLSTTTGIIKNGSGNLFLGGTAPNTFVGVNTLNAGQITAGKVNALGAGNDLIMAGGSFDTGGFSQTLGTLDLDGTASMDFGAGTVAVSFENSSSLYWGGVDLNILNWTAGLDTLRFGTDATGLTWEQLARVHFIGSGFDHAEIDSGGYLTPIPEPSATFILIGGLVALLGGARIVRRRS